MNWMRALRSPRLGPVEPLPRRVEQAGTITLGIMGFMLPGSVAGVSLCMAALLVLTLIAAPRLWRQAPWREPTMAVGLVLLAFIALHTLVTTGWSGRGAVNRYHELLLAVVLLAWFRAIRGRDAFLWGLTLGGAVLCTLFWVGPFVPSLPPDELELRRISAGFVLAVSSLVLLVESGRMKSPWAWRAAALFLALTVLFRIDSRTGHLVMLVLVALAAWLASPPRWRVPAAVSLTALALAIAQLSPVVKERALETWTVLQDPQPDVVTSTGIRRALLGGAVAIAQDHYTTGVGYARYAEAHEATVTKLHGADPAWTEALRAPWVRSSNPHNEYLMQLAGGGVLGLALFLAWLGLPLLRRSAHGRGSLLLTAAVSSFAVSCLFNSALMDFVEGHFYASLLAWLLARQSVPSPRA